MQQKFCSDDTDITAQTCSHTHPLFTWPARSISPWHMREPFRTGFQTQNTRTVGIHKFPKTNILRSVAMARMDGRRALVATLAISGEEDTTRPCLCVLAMQEIALPLAMLQLPSFVQAATNKCDSKSCVAGRRWPWAITMRLIMRCIRADHG